jgi:hypothetical protein
MIQLLKSQILLLLIFLSQAAYSQSAWREKPKTTFSGFVDVFYVFDFNKPGTNSRQPFFYNHNRHNEFNLNLGYLKVSTENSRYRANIALQAGTYPNDNYAAELGALKNIFEANAGIALNSKSNLWLDAGIFGSHIGFESAISIDNWTLTRSLLAENSPYFETGARLTFTPTEKWEFAGLILNGWQRIQRVEGNSMPSFGTQLKFSPNEHFLINWSTFIGTTDPDSTRRMRYFNNFYGQFQLTEKIGLIAGFDLGLQQKEKNSMEYDTWLSPVIIGQYAFHQNWKAAIRGEYYLDQKGIIISTESPNEFKTAGLSLNLDYSPIPNIACRIEGRWLKSKDEIFETPESFRNQDFFIGSSISIKFSGITD